LQGWPTGGLGGGKNLKPSRPGSNWLENRIVGGVTLDNQNCERFTARCRGLEKGELKGTRMNSRKSREEDSSEVRAERAINWIQQKSTRVGTSKRQGLGSMGRDKGRGKAMGRRLADFYCKRRWGQSRQGLWGGVNRFRLKDKNAQNKKHLNETRCLPNIRRKCGKRTIVGLIKYVSMVDNYKKKGQGDNGGARVQKDRKTKEGGGKRELGGGSHRNIRDKTDTRQKGREKSS